MSLPACFVAAANATSPVPVTVIDRGSYPGWREAQDAATLAWLDANAFTPAAGSFMLLPGAQGKPRGVVAADGDPSIDARYELAR